MILLDECWMFFDNPAFKAKLREYFKDMRKKNTSIIFATQNLSDIASKEDLMTTVMENCPNRIYLPNANAMNQQNMEMYRMFGCNDRQIQIISEITPKQDYYYSSEKGNRIFSLALQPAELPFVTATGKSDQQKINQILAAGRKDHFIEDWFKFKDAEDEWEKYQTYLTAPTQKGVETHE
jgi:type IV secretion system protein VirB4